MTCPRTMRSSISRSIFRSWAVTSAFFCLLMTVTNILNTKFMMQQQDTGANPQMAAMKWMSYLMPVMFLFILNDYPSGLNYYYFIFDACQCGNYHHHAQNDE